MDMNGTPNAIWRQPTLPCRTVSMTQPTSATKRPATFVRIAEVCEVLGMSTEGAYKAIAKGRFPLPVERIGNLWKVRRADLDAFVAGK